MICRQNRWSGGSWTRSPTGPRAISSLKSTPTAASAPTRVPSAPPLCARSAGSLSRASPFCSGARRPSQRSGLARPRRANPRQRRPARRLSPSGPLPPRRAEARASRRRPPPPPPPTRGAFSPASERGLLAALPGTRWRRSRTRLATPSECPPRSAPLPPLSPARRCLPSRCVAPGTTAAAARWLRLRSTSTRRPSWCRCGRHSPPSAPSRPRQRRAPLCTLGGRLAEPSARTFSEASSRCAYASHGGVLLAPQHAALPTGHALPPGQPWELAPHYGPPFQMQKQTPPSLRASQSHSAANALHGTAAPPSARSPPLLRRGRPPASLRTVWPGVLLPARTLSSDARTPPAHSLITGRRFISLAAVCLAASGHAGPRAPRSRADACLAASLSLSRPRLLPALSSQPCPHPCPPSLVLPALSSQPCPPSLVMCALAPGSAAARRAAAAAAGAAPAEGGDAEITRGHPRSPQIRRRTSRWPRCRSPRRIPPRWW